MKLTSILITTLAICPLAFSQDEDIVMADFENVTTPGGDFNFFGGGSQFGGAFDTSLDISSKTHIQLWVNTTSDASGSISLYSGPTPGSEVSAAGFELGGNEWTLVTVPLTDFQKTDGGAAPVDFSDVQAAQFFIVNTTSEGLQDLWLDDMVATNAEGGGNTWGLDWPVDEAGWVDTGNWLGFLNVGVDPWNWSASLNNWLYLPGDSVTQSGAWAYILAP
jgi:hypothetical protein